MSRTDQPEHQGSRDQQGGQPLWAGQADRKQCNGQKGREPGRSRIPPGGRGDTEEQRGARAGDQGAWPQPRPV
ncbi:MAG: hypothetical protein OXG65_01870 [Chloroflexi bacterium]|nr:hypothetical protein [Chloroflexota bacterium]